MYQFSGRQRVGGLVVVALAAMVLVGPVPASRALTKWDTIGAGWAYGGSSRLLDRPEEASDTNRARVYLGTTTASDPRRIRVVIEADELDEADNLSWWISCVDRQGAVWSERNRRRAPALPSRTTLFHAAVDGRVQACRLGVSVMGPEVEQPYQLRVKVQARYAGG
jgi:hypothetical protein